MGSMGSRRPTRLDGNVVISSGPGIPDVQVGQLGGPGSIYIDTDTGRRYSEGASCSWDFDHYQNLESLSGFMDDAITRTSVDHSHTYAGQVRVNWTGMSHTGFTAEEYVYFDYIGAEYSVSPWPTTTWPSNMVNPQFNPDVFDPTIPRIKENPIMGQTHVWRINGQFAGKAQNNTGHIDLEFYNPDSGFVTVMNIPMPQGRTEGPFSGTMNTVADDQSIGEGLGYRCRLRCTFSDNNLNVTLNNLLRVSLAVENKP